MGQANSNTKLTDVIYKLYAYIILCTYVMLPCTKEPVDAHILHMLIVFPFISPLSLLGVLHAVQLSLTPDNLMPLLQGVHNWWKGGEFNNGLLDVLGVPESKQQDIREQCGSDEEKAVAKCIEWWLEHATNVSWREIVHGLYEAKETRVADGIRQHAEPVQGSRKNKFYSQKSYLEFANVIIMKRDIASCMYMKSSVNHNSLSCE